MFPTNGAWVGVGHGKTYEKSGRYCI